jgi:hypothetical protein
MQENKEFLREQTEARELRVEGGGRMSLVQKVWQRTSQFLPVDGFHFDRPILIFQSDDWGRVGLRDREGFEELKAAGLELGEQPYDLYTLETAEDLAALRATLSGHRDSSGRPPCVQMNFVVANLDFERMSASGFQQIELLPLVDGLPGRWVRPGLIEGYRNGIGEGVFRPELHGITHFCRAAVDRNLKAGGERAEALRVLWKSDTSYLYWRMPWIGFEYWDGEQPSAERFLGAETQQQLIGQTVGMFVRLFNMLPRSACAPGFRANRDTHLAWAQHGVRIAQNGPGKLVPPHLDHHEMLHLTRNVDFEPGANRSFSLDSCLSQADTCFKLGIPAVVSMHSINFHSTVRDFRSPTLEVLNQFLNVLESRHPNLLYLHDYDLHELITKGSYRGADGRAETKVLRKKFLKATAQRLSRA